MAETAPPGAEPERGGPAAVDPPGPEGEPDPIGEVRRSERGPGPGNPAPPDARLGDGGPDDAGAPDDAAPAGRLLPGSADRSPGAPAAPTGAEPTADGPDGGGTALEDPAGSLIAAVRPSAPGVEGRGAFDACGSPSGDDPGRFIAMVGPLDLDGGGTEGPECGQGASEPPRPA